MRIHLDVTALAQPHYSGIGLYVRQLARGLKAQADLDFHAVWKMSRLRSAQDIEKHLGFPVEMYVPFISAFRMQRTDVFHGPDHRLISRAPGVKKIVTVHDMAVFQDGLLDAEFAGKNRERLNAVLNRRDLARVITVSKFSKEAILTRFPHLKDRIHVVPLGADHMPEAGKVNDKKFLIPVSFILFVGNIERRKNLERLIDAFEMVKRDFKELALVIVGRDGFDAEVVHQKIKRSSCAESIICKGHASAEELSAYYAKAQCFVYPSLYEGFGIPILEAMTQACPVITSNMGAMKEVASDAALLVDPMRAEDIADKIGVIMRDMTVRADYSFRGLQHSARYFWSDTVEKTLEVYRA